MKTKYLLIVFAFFSFGTLGIAQEKSRCLGQPQKRLPWKEYRSPDARFRICFPDVPKELDLPFDTKIGHIVSHSFFYNSDVTYVLNYTDYPIDSVPPDGAKRLLDDARDGGLARVAKEDPRIVSESDISVEGYPGRFIRVELKGNAILRHKMILAGNRLYIISVGTPKAGEQTSNRQNTYEKAANNFFDSFKILPPLAADLAATWKDFYSTEGKFKIQFPGTPYEYTSMGEGREALRMHTTTYQSSFSYDVSYVDYPQLPTDPAALRTFLDNNCKREFEWLEQQGVKSTMLMETDVTVDGYPGRFLVAEISIGEIYRRKMVVVKNRVYTIEASTPKSDSDARDNKLYEKLSMRFIDSFRPSGP